MAKDDPPSSSGSGAAPSPPLKKKQAGFLTRGLSHAKILARRKSLKTQLHSLPPEERSRVQSHLHAGQGDLSRLRLANLRRNDRNRDTSNLTDYQVIGTCRSVPSKS